MNKSFLKFVTDFGPLLVFFTFYYKNEKNLEIAIPPFILATLIVSFNLTVSVLTHSWAFGGFTERAIKVEHFSKYFSPLFSFAALGIILVLTTGGATH